MTFSGTFPSPKTTLLNLSLLSFALASFERQETGIVYPRMISSRSDTGEKVLKIREDLTLKLIRSTVFSEQFLVHTTVDGTPARYVVNGEDAEANLYHDAETMSSLHVSEEDGLEILGVLGHTLRIKPAPEIARSLDGHIAHVLFHADEPDLPVEEERNDYGVPDFEKYGEKASTFADESSYAASSDVPNGTLRAAKDYGGILQNASPLIESRSSSRRHRLPKHIYPEVHIVADYLYCKAYDFDTRSILRSLAILTNAANLRYLSLRQPKVTLRIVGVSITKSEAEEPYMVKVKGYEKTRNILYEHTLWNFTVYSRKQDYFKTADIAFLLTVRNLSEWRNRELITWVGGYAYIGAVCTPWKVAMSEERPHSFYGVYVYAHEVAHVLGCAHDGDKPRGWPAGLIGSEDCPFKDGYMMSYKFVEPYMYRFSRCCEREIMNIYNRPNYTCLQYTQSKYYYSTKWPAYNMNWDRYCQKVYYSYRDVTADKRKGNTDNCLLTCFTSKRKSHSESKLAYVVDGTKCRGNGVCMLGNCSTTTKITNYRE
ncbi:venom metalloproteinase BumaMPs1-like [Haemaphysalis longicornis]